ncbi:MAG TPA: S8 family serine peptidase [Longimicrobiaceae bacterium]|jgi:subtilisin family serine protease|nr:S8 family serine peptidase [Longimicrobiaceae bacterium]
MEFIFHGNDTGAELDRTRVAVRFREPAPHAVRRDVAGMDALAGPQAPRYEIPGEKYTVFELSPEAGVTENATEYALRELRDHPAVVRAVPVYRAGTTSLVATDRIVVGMERSARGPVSMFERRGWEVVWQFGTDYVVRLAEHEDPVAQARAIAAQPGVLYAAPDLVEYRPVREPGASQPDAPPDSSDPLASSQWARVRTRADDALKAVGGAGSPAIRIAVIDSGVDRTHPDLAGRIVGFADMVDNPPHDNPQDADYHGTACAGLAAAIPFNSEGIRGFGGGCSILSARVMHTAGTEPMWNIAPAAVARGIDWAVANGADVISLSLYLEHPHPAVENAIRRAAGQGRNGKGCVIVAGAGNLGPSDKGVKFPARLPDVIAAAATNDADEPVGLNADKSGWISAWGEEVDIAAPGQRQVTTDISGALGAARAVATPGNYVRNFDGTSSSAAIVAGAAALVLSANPELTAGQVRDILCSTAYKPRPQEFPNGRNDQMGAGRVDLLAAVQKGLASKAGR